MQEQKLILDQVLVGSILHGDCHLSTFSFAAVISLRLPIRVKVRNGISITVRFRMFPSGC
jgi:hypothetical protein